MKRIPSSAPCAVLQIIVTAELRRVRSLQQPQQEQRDDLHRHHTNERASEAGFRFWGESRVEVHGRTAPEDGVGGRLAARWSADKRLMNSRAAPGLPAGSC